MKLFLKTLGIAFIVGVNFMASCELEKDFEIILPEYDNQMVVEAYVIPNRPLRLTLIEGNDYLDPYLDTLTGLPNISLISQALVTVSYTGITDTLDNTLGIDFDGKLFNYTTSSNFPEIYYTTIELEIRDTLNNRVARATTEIIPPAQIDSNWVEWSGGSALLLTRFVDDPVRDNFYRRLLHSDSVLGSKLETDFVFDDQFADSDNKLIVGSGPNFGSGDTAITTIYTITEAYFDFYTSVDNAVSSNGNPFAIPAPIISNVLGGTGIFTGLTFDRDTILVP